MQLFLVYQNGHANVFDGNFRRLLQHAYTSCEWFCRGAMATAGAEVTVYHCDKLGDIADQRLGAWRDGPGPLHAASKRPPKPEDTHVRSA